VDANFDDLENYNSLARRELALLEVLARLAGDEIERGQSELSSRYEKAIHDYETRFQATFENAAVGIANVAPDGRFLRDGSHLFITPEWLMNGSGPVRLDRCRLMARRCRVWRCSKSAAIWGIPVIVLTYSRRQPVTHSSTELMNPNDDQIRAMIAAQLIKFVDYATHHLVEGLFIGDEAEAEAALVEAAAVLKEVSDPSSVQPLSLSALLADWLEYRDAPQGSFPEWCHRRNRTHRWWSIVYYDQRKG
jgi:hypothetical protein